MELLDPFIPGVPVHTSIEAPLRRYDMNQMYCLAVRGIRTGDEDGPSATGRILVRLHGSATAVSSIHCRLTSQYCNK